MKQGTVVKYSIYKSVQRKTLRRDEAIVHFKALCHSYVTFTDDSEAIISEVIIRQ